MKPTLRFKGFDGEWERVPFNDLFSHISNNTLSRSQLSNNGTVKNIHYGDVLIKYGEHVNIKNDDVTFVKDCSYQPDKNILLQNGDIIFADAAEDATVGKCSEVIGINADKVVSGLHTIAVRPTIPFANKYLGFYLNTPAYHDQFLTLMQGTKVFSISKKAINETELHIPTFAEQDKIASYLDSLTAQIQASTARLSRLEQVKRGSLQAMFPLPGQTAPALRFKGFTGEWKRVKLGEMLSIDVNPNKDNVFKREDVLSVSGEYGLVNQIKFQGRSFAGESLTNYKITHLGQIVYTKSPLKESPYGIIKCNMYGDGILSPLYAVYNATEQCAPEFIHYYFAQQARLNNYLLPLINKGAKNTINVSDAEALQGVILVPTKGEQEAIGAYFKELDRQLQLEGAKLGKLRQLKQASLCQLFV